LFTFIFPLIFFFLFSFLLSFIFYLQLISIFTNLSPAAGGGSIINTASFVACLGAATPQLAYTSSKGAVLAMTRELAVIHARQHIRVNALCPGPLNTELLQKYLNTPEKKNRRLVHVPMGRFGNADEIGKGNSF
jgi:NAD(P)-dependent dehydrogenase (short-subunit alcohol dehydrogenase family)